MRKKEEEREYTTKENQPSVGMYACQAQIRI